MTTPLSAGTPAEPVGETAAEGIRTVPLAAPTGALVLLVRFDAYDAPTRTALFSTEEKARRWLVEQIDRHEWEQWRDSMRRHEGPDVVTPEPGVDDDEVVLDAWFGEPGIVVHPLRPELRACLWGDDPEVGASIEPLLLDEASINWDN